MTLTDFLDWLENAVTNEQFEAAITAVSVAFTIEGREYAIRRGRLTVNGYRIPLSITEMIRCVFFVRRMWGKQKKRDRAEAFSISTRRAGIDPTNMTNTG